MSEKIKNPPGILKVIFEISRILIFIFMFSVFYFMVPPGRCMAAETPLCEICSNEISGQYYKVKDPESDKAEIFVCLSCYESTPRCEVCTGFMRKAHEFGGKNICKGCYEHYKDSPLCEICKINILGAYVKFTDPSTGKVSFVCEPCKKNSPACSLCNLPCASPAKVAGQSLCESCALKAKAAPVCKICDNPILTSYTHYKDKKTGTVIYVCDVCAKANGKCFVCGVPDANLKEAQRKDVCPKCFAELKKCYGCGNYIFRLSYKYDLTEQQYCEGCQKNTDKCDVCGLPTGANPVKLTDGRKICPDCESTAVKDVTEVRDLYASVAVFLSSDYHMDIGNVNKISFKEINEMRELGEKTPTAEKGVIPLGIFSRSGKEFDIFVQKNLPKNLLIGVLAHEYAHAFVHDRLPDFNDTLIDEGFAEWIRHKTLLKIGDDKGAKLIERRKDIYGDGFRKITEIESGKGIEGVFALFEKKW